MSTTNARATTEKVDFKKVLPSLYAPKGQQWHRVAVPRQQFLMIDGKGDPNISAEYAAAVEALYSLSYPLKFMSKKELGKDYVVPPLEGLWYADDLGVFETGNKDAYQWTMMIKQPDWITEEFFRRALAAAKLKKPNALYGAVRLEPYEEGLCLQRLHIGSYDEEAPSLHYLHHDLMPQQNFTFNGHHHEIYLSDPRRVAPERLKTILRQPVKE